MEIWKIIQDYEGLYQVSNTGKVRDLKNHIKPVYKNNKGYMCLSLYYNGKTYHPTVHRLVAKTFIPNPNNYEQVNHKDCNKENNTTIINVTHDLEDTIYGKDIIVMDKGKIIIKGSKEDVLREEKIFNKIGLDLPFIVELSIKLNYYGLLDKICFSNSELVKSIWK